ncbi:HipA domain-containing protein [Candidatus Poriferisodalis sp.]|uniref:HipA domain-containing protein n=1 Tax=Candidatus Poriferisodalis sp. TaxID=3101277 RepID=UPI003B5B4600
MADLQVFINGVLAGDITAGTGDDAVFAYAPSYLRQGRATPLSLSAPLIGGSHAVGAWLDGLLPDNDEVRREWAQENGAADTRPITLLGTPVGLDCAGAAQFCRPGSEESLGREGGLETQTHSDIAAWVRQARQAWHAGGRIGTHGLFSLGGAQAKYALHRDGDRWAVPFGDVPTTHIIKPAMAGHADADAVEHVCLRAAHLVGLDAARTELVRFEDERVLAVERFDRAHHDDRLVRVHHEDLCQALGVAPDDKYQADGGPSPAQIAELFQRESTDPAGDTRQFRDALIFNWAIAAPDAHAKNYSLLLESGEVRLAPLYDVISYLPYADEPWPRIRTAMRIGRDYTLRKADRPAAWERTADTLGLDRGETLRRIYEMLRDVPEAVGDAVTELDDDDRNTTPIKNLRARVAQRVGDLRAQFARPAKPANHPAAPPRQSLAADESTRRVLVCGAPLRSNRGTCRRRLTTQPCPFHPASPGSMAIEGRSDVFFGDSPAP